jgi:hypothetical protein
LAVLFDEDPHGGLDPAGHVGKLLRQRIRRLSDVTDRVLEGAKPAFALGNTGPVQMASPRVVNAVGIQTGVRPVPSRNAQSGRVLRGLLELGASNLTSVVSLGTED